MRHRSTLISFVFMLLAGLILPAQAIAQTASPAAGAPEPTISEAQAAAVPLGTVATVGDLELRVVSYQPDASALFGADSLSFTESWQQVIAVELEVTNIGSEAVDTSGYWAWFAGASGLLGIVFPECNTAHQFNGESEPVAPGETVTSTVCSRVSKADLDSLHMWMQPQSAEGWLAGTWFDLGAPVSPVSDLSANDLATLAASDAAAATMTAATFAPGGVRVGDLHYQVTSWETDGTATIAAAAEDALLPDPFPTPLLTLTITNLGDEPLYPAVWLLGPDGVGLDPAYVSGSLANPSGALLPGYQITRNYAWQDVDSVGTNAALLLSPATSTSDLPGWTMMIEGPAPQGPAPVLDVAPDGTGQTVPLGTEVSLVGVNIQLAQNPSGETPYLATLTATGAAGTARNIQLAFKQGDASCDIIQSDGNTTSYTSMVRVMLATGAQTRLPVSCQNGSDPAMPIAVTSSPYLNPQTVEFDVTTTAADGAATESEPAATEAASETATEAVANDSTSPETAGTATVIAATANVRDAATTAGIVVDVVSAGEVVTITGEGVEADGYTWLPIVTPGGVSGWIASHLVQVAS